MDADARRWGSGRGRRVDWLCLGKVGRALRCAPREAGGRRDRTGKDLRPQMDADVPGVAKRSQRRRFWTGFTGFTGLRSDQAILVLLFRNPVHPVNPGNFVPKMNDSPGLQHKRPFVHAVQYERSVHSRQDFTTDFRISRMRKSSRRSNALSVSS
jgi:hypothetical protein